MDWNGEEARFHLEDLANVSHGLSEFRGEASLDVLVDLVHMIPTIQEHDLNPIAGKKFQCILYNWGVGEWKKTLVSWREYAHPPGA